MKVFEDFEVGATETFGDYRITEQEIIEFARKYDPQPIHTDPDFAKKSFHGGLIASGWLTCSVMMRLLCDHILTQSHSIGSPGVDNLRWLVPVKPGDRLRASIKVLKARELNSKPGVGVVNYHVTLLNQQDEAVMTLTSAGMFLTRDGVRRQQS
ncbi:MAG: MaoC family dehydratase [Alphaproteobacteria bacterium]|nr:MaoC family dehydratase [Alphaproteobacteria bacterium]